MKRLLLSTIVLLAFLLFFPFKQVSAQILLYEIDSKFDYPEVYIPQTIAFVQDFQEMNTNLENNKSDDVISYVVGDHPELKDVLPNTPVNTNRPKVIYKKINNSKYLVRVINPTKEFILVFNQAFHNGWILRSYSGDFSCDPKRLFEKFSSTECETDSSVVQYFHDFFDRITNKDLQANHFKINNLVNSWNVKNQGTADLTFTIEFEIQKFFYFGLITTTFTSIILFVILFLGPVFHTIKNIRDHLKG